MFIISVTCCNINAFYFVDIVYQVALHLYLSMCYIFRQYANGMQTVCKKSLSCRFVFFHCAALLFVEDVGVAVGHAAVCVSEDVL